VSESLYTTQVPDSGLGDLADLTKGTTATAITFATAGTVTHIRFYAPATIAGGTTFTGELWRADTDDSTSSGTGTLLGSKAASGAGMTGATWNTIAFDTPVSVSPGVVYRAAVHNTAGRYVAIVGFFSAADLVNGNITGIRSGTNPNPPGIGTIRNGTFFDNADAGTYPNKNFNQPSYLVDVVFEASSGTVTGAGTSSATSADTVAGRVRVRAAGSSTGSSSSTAAARVRVRAAGSSAAVSNDTAAALGAVAGVPIVTVSLSQPLVTVSIGGTG